MNILAVGDLVGENGLEKLTEVITKIREEYNIDFVIVNAENKVVSTITLLVNVPSDFIFFAIM